MEVALLAFGIAQAAVAAAVKLGLIGDPSWQSALGLAMTAMTKALQVVDDIRGGAAQYDRLTPAEIRALLLPTELSSLERAVAAELGLT